MTTIEELKEEVKTAMDETDWEEYEEWEDIVHEIVDEKVPKYTDTILEVAIADTSLAMKEPLTHAFDGSKTGRNAIAGVIFEELEATAYQYYETEIDPEYD